MNTDPSVSVLEPGSWGGVAVLFGLAAVFTLVPLGFLIAVWRIDRKGATSQSSGIRDSKSHSARMRFGISALLLVFIGIGCIPLTMAAHGMHEARASLTWPTVPDLTRTPRRSNTNSRLKERLTTVRESPLSAISLVTNPLL